MLAQTGMFVDNIDTMQWYEGFLNSNFFQSMVTLIAASVALLIFYLRRRHAKRDSAKTLLLEIEAAERKLKDIKKALKDGVVRSAKVMPTNSWALHQHMFVNDFNRAEWDSIVEFYDLADQVDQVLKYQSSSYWDDADLVRANRQRIAADITAKIVSDKLTEQKETGGVNADMVREEVKIYMDGMTETYENTATTYTPKQVQSELETLLNTAQLDLSITTVGMRLKALQSRKLLRKN